MAVRRESVVLDVTDHLTPALIKSGAAAELLKRNLKDLDGTAISGRGVEKVGKDAEVTGRKVEDAGRKVDNTSKAFERGEKSIDKYSGRLGLLAQAAVTIGPALLPLGAGTIPAIAGLTAGLGAAAGAFGVTLLAAKGMGDGLKAIDAYQLAPTTENLAKLTDELNKLGPAGAEFAVYLDGLEPKLKALQQTARAGLFPGVEQGIDSLLGRLPQVQTIIGEIARESGSLAADAGSSLAGPKFNEFFDYLQTRAAPIMHEFAEASGNVVEGLANILVAFDPLTRSFTGGLLSMTQDFAKWSRSLDTNDGFQRFLAYAQENGPKVMDFIGSLISALASIAQAAAPVGNVVLPLLTDLLKVVDALASSNFGAPAVAALAAYSALNRTLAVTVALQKAATGFKGKALGTSTTGSALGGAELAGPIGVGVAALAVEVLSIVHANDQLKSSFAQVQSAIDNVQFDSYGAKLDDLKKKTEAQAKDSNNRGIAASVGLFSVNPGSVVASALELGRAQNQENGVSKATAQYTALQAEMKASEQAAAGVGRALGLTIGPLDGSARSAQELTNAYKAAAPAMDALNITPDQLTALRQTQNSARNGLPDGQKFLTTQTDAANAYDNKLREIKAEMQSLNSTAGRQNAVADAIAGISSAALDGISPVDRLQAALDNLLNPQLDLIQAQDALTSGLRHLGESLAKNNKTLKGGSDAAIQNRAAVGQQVQGIESLLTAQAKAGATSGQLSASLAKQRGALIKAGQAAGISKSAMSEYLNEINLTPKFVQTLIKNTADEAKGKAAAYKAFLLGLPKVTTTYIRTVHQDIRQGVSAASSAQDIGPARKANGGLITGPGGPRDDMIPALLSNREYVINAAAVARYGVGMFHAINAQRLADGGQPGGNVRTTGVMGWDGKPLADSAKQATAGLKGLKGRLDDANKALDKQKQKLDDIRSKQSDLASSVTSGLRSDPFAASGGDIYASGATTYDPLGVLRGDIRNAKQFRGLDKRLQKRGLDGAALAAAEAAGLTGLQSLNGLGAGGLRDFERLYNQRQRLTGTIGRQSGSAVYGDAVKANTKELRELRGNVHRLEAALRAEHKRDRAEAKKNSDKNAEHVTKGINGAATNGGHRRPGGMTRT